MDYSEFRMDFYVVPTLRHHEKLLQEGRQHQIDRPSWDRLFVEVVMRNESFSTEEKLEFIEDIRDGDKFESFWVGERAKHGLTAKATAVYDPEKWAGRRKRTREQAPSPSTQASSTSEESSESSSGGSGGGGDTNARGSPKTAYKFANKTVKSFADPRAPTTKKRGRKPGPKKGSRVKPHKTAAGPSRGQDDEGVAGPSAEGSG